MSLRLATFNVENLLSRFDFTGFRNQTRQDRVLRLFSIRSEAEFQRLEEARAIALADDARQQSALAIADADADVLAGRAAASGLFAGDDIGGIDGDAAFAFAGELGEPAAADALAHVRFDNEVFRDLASFVGDGTEDRHRGPEDLGAGERRGASGLHEGGADNRRERKDGHERVTEGARPREALESAPPTERTR